MNYQEFPDSNPKLSHFDNSRNFGKLAFMYTRYSFFFKLNTLWMWSISTSFLRTCAKQQQKIESVKEEIMEKSDFAIKSRRIIYLIKRAINNKDRKFKLKLIADWKMKMMGIWKKWKWNGFCFWYIYFPPVHCVFNLS